MLAKMFGQRGQNLFFRQYDDLSPCLLFVQMLGQSVKNLFFDNMMIFHGVCPQGSRLGEEDRPDGGGAQRPLRQVR